MPKIHYFQRYSSVENTVTNNTLQLLARVYNYSTTYASRLLTDITGQPIEIGIEINQQQRAKESVPDGAVIQRSFKVLIESKVESGVDEDQLIKHAANFSTESLKILLLLTKQKLSEEEQHAIAKSIASKYPGVVFTNVTYEEICHSIETLFKDFEVEMQSLMNDYVEYCNDANLFDQSKYLMRIVPCGVSLDLNKQYGIYFYPSDRGYTKHSYIGIYAQKAVQCIWKIDSVFDISWDGKSLTKTLAEGKDTKDFDEKIIGIIKEAKIVCGYDIEDDHRFFCGKDVYPTKYIKKSPGGIQGARFVNLKEEIGEFVNAGDVARKLDGKQWE